MRAPGRVALGVVLSLAVGPVACGSDTPPPVDDLAAVSTWAFAIGDGTLDGPDDDVAARLRPYDLVIVDGEEVSEQQVAAVQEDGTIVLAYLSVGTIEEGRTWSDRAEPYRLELWEDWGEWFADTSEPGFRSLIVDDVAVEMLDKGVDGLFLDNTAMIADHPDQADGMYELVRALSDLVHGRDGYLFTQNGADELEPVLDELDGWNLEDVSSTYDFDLGDYVVVDQEQLAWNIEEIGRMKEAGLLVTATDYIAEGEDELTDEAAERACAAGALPFVSDIELIRLPREPLTC